MFGRVGHVMGYILRHRMHRSKESEVKYWGKWKMALNKSFQSFQEVGLGE